jgi:hypothetical protein
MNIATPCLAERMLFGILVVVGCWLASPARMSAQCVGSMCAGYNAVFNSSGTTVASSAAFIDASVATFSNNANGDFCTQVYNALLFAQKMSPQPAGVVIDARGIGANPASCGAGSTPWIQSLKDPIIIPSTILLPPGNINIAMTWTLPDRTRIFGLGKTQTNIAAASNFAGPMLQMCTAACSGVSIADIHLDGGGQILTGILNSFASDLSYVQDVAITQVEGTGLDVENSGANRSGPYTDLNITAGILNVQTSTACIKIINASTRGVHGLTCTADGTPDAGIYLDGNNNTIEDVHFEGVKDGVRVGQNAAAAGNVVSNITGATGSGILQNIIHICGANPPNAGNRCLQFSAVTDLALWQIELGPLHINIHDTLLDDITGTELGSSTNDFSVSTYIHGQPVTIGSSTGHSRFTTATNSSSTPTPTPDWGQAALGSTGTPSNPCPTGAIFSNTSGTSSGTSRHVLWVCTGGVWTNVK